MKKNTASQVIGVQMVTASDGSAFTGTVTNTYTIDGGTQTAGATVTHEGNGVYIVRFVGNNVVKRKVVYLK